MLNLFIQLSENDKRILIAVLLAIILIFVLIGLIGMGVQRLMKWQGKRMDTLVHDAVKTRVVSDKKHLRRYGSKKNWVLFFKQSWFALVLIIVAFLTLLITCLIKENFNYNVFDHKKTGFTTLFFLWDFSAPVEKYDILVQTGLFIIRWPPLMNTPHFEVDAISSYVFLITFIVGVIWYLTAVLAYISRSLRLFKLCTSIFEKSLEGFNINDEQMKNKVTEQSGN
jgi:hypothetical protein